jgi:hypothetical protein
MWDGRETTQNTKENTMKNNIDTVVKDLLNVEEDIADLKDRQSQLRKQLEQMLEPDINNQLAHEDYHTGTVNIDTAEHKIKVVVPKKVKWDQGKLLELHDRIVTHGDDPRVYMKAEFKVSETNFKNWPVEIQDAFSDCRTVEQGTISFKFEEK